MNTQQPASHPALQRLDAFVGEWRMAASFPTPESTGATADSKASTGAHPDVFGARTVFEWVLEGQFLAQRAEVPQTPAAPDVLAIIGVSPDGDDYRQHYFDSRGVVRIYSMTFSDGVWTLLRNSPDFSPLDFHQRFTGTFSDRDNTIKGAWESSNDGSSWHHDFALTYTRVIQPGISAKSA